MTRVMLFVLAAVAALTWCHGRLIAAEGQPVKKAQDGQSAKKTSERDPVEAAFRLPRGVQLSQRQREAFEKMRGQIEPRLRKALDDLADAKDERSKRVVVKQVTQIRQEIRDEINQIVNSPSEGRSDARREGASSGGSERGDSGRGELPRGYMPGWPVWHGYPYPVVRPGYWRGERAEGERAAALKGEAKERRLGDRAAGLKGEGQQRAAGDKPAGERTAAKESERRQAAPPPMPRAQTPVVKPKVEAARVTPTTPRPVSQGKR